MAANKLATEGYTRIAALELSQFGVTADIISSGPVQKGWVYCPAFFKT
jgi:hypothetical protein